MGAKYAQRLHFLTISPSKLNAIMRVLQANNPQSAHTVILQQLTAYMWM